MASVGDRVVNPANPSDGAGAYAVYESTDETAAQGARQAAQLVKIVGDSGDTIDPSATPKSSTSNTPAIGTTSATVLAANASRKLWSIQNVGTNPLFVRLGASASSTLFHFVLRAGTVDSDGLGGVITDDAWTGIVSVSGTSPKYTVTELS